MVAALSESSWHLQVSWAPVRTRVVFRRGSTEKDFGFQPHYSLTKLQRQFFREGNLMILPECCLGGCRQTTVFHLFLVSLATFLRRTRAAIIIQKFQRMYVIRKRYRRTRAATVVLQSYSRGYLARKRYRKVGVPGFYFLISNLCSPSLSFSV